MEGNYKNKQKIENTIKKQESYWTLIRNEEKQKAGIPYFSILMPVNNHYVSNSKITDLVVVSSVSSSSTIR